MSIPARVRELLAEVQRSASDLTDLVLQIASVPAPTGHEAARSERLAELWRAAGLDDVTRDELGNVTGTLHGTRSAPRLLVVANMDYAYPAGSEVAPHLDGDVVRGSGVYDNAAGLAVLLGAARILAASGVLLPGEVIFAATVLEEWGGNLRGMRALMDRHGDHLTGVLNVGHDLAGLHHEAFGMTTLRLAVTGPGGHSYAHLGTPSAVHTIVALLDEIITLKRPDVPKTSLNVGVIDGGTSGNGIAEHASAVIEIRSLDAGVLADLESRMRQVVHDAAIGPGIGVEWSELDRRPYGAIPASHPLVELVADAHREVGVGVRTEPSAADFNIPLGRGIPAIITGAATGGGIKSAREYLEHASLVPGVQSLLLALGLLTDHPWTNVTTPRGSSAQ
jgi:tripeptide aminopeptidase